jgi:hypothetical protein
MLAGNMNNSLEDTFILRSDNLDRCLCEEARLDFFFNFLLLPIFNI